METKPPEESKATSSVTLIKLCLLALIAFAVTKFGVPLMDQISEKSKNLLNAKKQGQEIDETLNESEEDVVIEDGKEADAAAMNVRITKGYGAWEPSVREQLEEWMEEGMQYKLISIAVNETEGKMEIRYSTEDADGYVGRGKLMLSKDGFGERFSFAEGEKEFIVYPPE